METPRQLENLAVASSFDEAFPFETFQPEVMQRHFAELGDIFEAGKGAMASQKIRRLSVDEVQIGFLWQSFKTQPGNSSKLTTLPDMWVSIVMGVPKT